MLELRRLEIEGFGPFATRQVVEFPREGVIVVYGDNMRGKTSLLNAIRYAFYGTIVGRSLRRRRIHTLSNRELAEQGRYGFSVVLLVEFDGLEYEMTRACTLKPGRMLPRDDADYEETVSLRQGDRLLGPHERDAALARMLPERVSRFFLFDGELLQEYEELLYNESEAGRKISESIESILGMPILKRARAHLAMLTEEADAAAAREARRSQETAQYGTAIDQTREQRDEHKRALTRLRAELADLVEQKNEAEGYLQTVQRYSAILQERDSCDGRLNRVKDELALADADLQRTMREAWRTVLAVPVRVGRASVASQVEQHAGQVMLALRKRAADEGHCGTCEREVDTSLAARLRASAELHVGVDVTLRPAFAQLADLNKFVEQDVSAAARQLARRIGDLRLEQGHLLDKLQDLNTELGDANIERMRSSSSSLGDLMRKIAVVETAITDTEKKVAVLETNISRLNSKLEGLGSADLRASQSRAKMLRSTSQLFAAAVEAYKAELRGRVEQTATELFLRMTTERNDYLRLEISGDYGLNIIHRRGGWEDGRSAGAEHIVALSLMGALQRNAPLRGPIVMDSPFGRLDEGHRANVVGTLPQMARQVVLLAHEGEVRRSQVREILGHNLVSEYELVRVSARRTAIEVVR